MLKSTKRKTLEKGARVLVLENLQNKLRGMGYCATSETRMGVQLLHVWHASSPTTVEDMYAILPHGVTHSLEIKRHTEIGVSIRLKTL